MAVVVISSTEKSSEKPLSLLPRSWGGVPGTDSRGGGGEGSRMNLAENGEDDVVCCTATDDDEEDVDLGNGGRISQSPIGPPYVTDERSTSPFLLLMLLPSFDVVVVATLRWPWEAAEAAAQQLPLPSLTFRQQ